MRVLKSILLGSSILVPFSIVGILGIIAFKFLVDNYPAILVMGIFIFGILLVFYCLGSSILGGVQEATEEDIREEVINEMQKLDSKIVENVYEHINLRERDIETYHKFRTDLNRDKWKGHLGFGNITYDTRVELEEACKCWEEKYNL